MPTRDVIRWAPSHPICLVATALLLLNDHLLKDAWPGLITGKLSDVCWLIVAPVVVASVLAWMRLPSRWAIRVALAAVALAFVLLQTWSPLGDTWVAWFGGRHTPDLTDLLTLPALLLAVGCWRPTPKIPLALPVAGIACVATSYSWCNQLRTPDDGVTDFDPNAPLLMSWGSEARAVPHDAYVVLSNVRVLQEGTEVPLVAASSSSEVFLCPVGGLLPDTEYTWVVDEMETDSTNQAYVSTFRLTGPYTFRTKAESDFLPAFTERQCAELASQVYGWVCAGDTGFWDTGFGFETGI